MVRTYENWNNVRVFRRLTRDNQTANVTYSDLSDIRQGVMELNEEISETQRNDPIVREKLQQLLAVTTSGAKNIMNKTKRRLINSSISRWLTELKYELTRVEEDEKAQYNAVASNLVYMETIMANRTPFQRKLDAIVRVKFGVPKMENEAANADAIRHFLENYMKNHCPSIRVVDAIEHIEWAITRAFLPTPEESKLTEIRRVAAYRQLNMAFHGTANLREDILKRCPSKWQRIKWLFLGKPANRNLEKVEAGLMKRHSIFYSSIEHNPRELDVPDSVGMFNPYHVDGTSQEPPVISPVGEGVKTGPKNTEPAGIVTTLEQC